MTIIDPYYYSEAIQHVYQIKDFFVAVFTQKDPETASVYFTFGLLCLKTDQFEKCVEDLSLAHMIYAEKLGELDMKTKEVEAVLRSLDQFNGKF